MRVRIVTSDCAVGIDSGVIVEPSGDFDVTLEVADGVMMPGLINAHDHLHRNHYGRLGAGRYANAYEWGRDIQTRYADEISRGKALPRREMLMRGAWKNLRAGVTTVVHHDTWEPDFGFHFPLRVAPVRWAHSLGLSTQLPAPAYGTPFAIHLAEGVDATSCAEVHRLAALGLVTEDLVAVHVVGADDAGVEMLRAAGAAIVWCPSSNQFLFGRTAPARLLAPGIDVLVGSDSLLTAEGSLLAELRIARDHGLLSDERLTDAVTTVAARRLGIDAPSLEPGARADVIVLGRPLLEASEKDVVIVVAAGVIRVLDPALLPSLGGRAQVGRVESAGGVERWVCDRGPA
jgi:cytosine/adenosine deaminase-related metal-dependent hydrolase